MSSRPRMGDNSSRRSQAGGDGELDPALSALARWPRTPARRLPEPRVGVSAGGPYGRTSAAAGAGNRPPRVRALAGPVPATRPAPDLRRPPASRPAGVSLPLSIVRRDAELTRTHTFSLSRSLFSHHPRIPKPHLPGMRWNPLSRDQGPIRRPVRLHQRAVGPGRMRGTDSACSRSRLPPRCHSCCGKEGIGLRPALRSTPPLG